MRLAELEMKAIIVPVQLQMTPMNTSNLLWPSIVFQVALVRAMVIDEQSELMVNRQNQNTAMRYSISFNRASLMIAGMIISPSSIPPP